MKRRTGRTWTERLLAAAVFLGAMATAPAVSTEAAEDGKLGWEQTADGVSFYDETGKLTKGWKQISGKWYSFNTKGLLQTGWVQSGSKWCFIGTNGVMLKKKWKQWKGNWYYLEGSGYAATGWKQLSGKWYFFRKDGTMVTEEYVDGYWMGKDGCWDGRNAKATWKKDAKGWYYMEKTGWYPRKTWLWIDQVCYYFDGRGYMVTNKTVDGYTLNKDGACTKNGTVVTHSGAKKTSSLVKELAKADTAFTYKVTPMLEPFNSFFFIETDNPDPDSFSFSDKSTVYGETGSIAATDTRYEDVKYVNRSTGRVKGGYIAAGSYTDGGELVVVERKVISTTPVTNLTTGEVTYRKNYEMVETDKKVKVAKVEDDVDYLIDTYAAGKKKFFDKLDAVQTGLGSICLYSGVYVLGELYHSESTPYYGISTSPHIDQRYYIQSPYGRRNSKSMLMSALYPYRLDSLGFPGEISAVAKRIDSTATSTRNANSHWLNDITYKGETKSYGGQGSGGGQGINASQILYTFSFDGGKKDAATKINMTDVKSRICEYGKLTVDEDEGKTIPKLTWAKIRKEVGEGSYVRIYLLTSVFGGGSIGYTYLYDNGATTEGVSYMGNVGYMYNTWFEGRYYNKYEYYYPGATLQGTVDDDQAPSLTFKDAVIKLPDDGRQYYAYRAKMVNGSNTYMERPVEEYGYDPETGTWPGFTTFTYNSETGNWTASQFASGSYGVYYKEDGKKVYLYSEDADGYDAYMDAVTITMDEAQAMELDENTNTDPAEFLIYDMRSEPGTPGTLESE